MFLDSLFTKRKFNSEVLDKVYSHEEVLDTLLGKLIKIDIGGTPDGSLYTLGLVLPDEKTGFAIYHRWERRENISIDRPYEEEAGLKLSRFDESYDFDPWGKTCSWFESLRIVGGDFMYGYQTESNPEYVSLDSMLNEHGLTIDLHNEKIREFN